MRIKCTSTETEAGALGRRRVVGDFDGGLITSGGGALPLCDAVRQLDVMGRLAARFVDFRNTVNTSIISRPLPLSG